MQYYVITGIGVIFSIAAAIITVCLMLGRYQEKVDNLKEEKSNQNTRLEKLRSDVDKLLEFKTTTQKFIDNKIYVSNSPLGLTEFGQKLVTESGFLDIFELVKDDLILKLQNKKPSTMYDVQEKARGLMTELTDYDAFKPIKTYAFNNGLDYEQILRAGAIILRDYYLHKHPEIKE